MAGSSGGARPGMELETGACALVFALGRRAQAQAHRRESMNAVLLSEARRLLRSTKGFFGLGPGSPARGAAAQQAQHAWEHNMLGNAPDCAGPDWQHAQSLMHRSLPATLGCLAPRSARQRTQVHAQRKRVLQRLHLSVHPQAAAPRKRLLVACSSGGMGLSERRTQKPESHSAASLLPLCAATAGCRTCEDLQSCKHSHAAAGWRRRQPVQAPCMASAALGRRQSQEAS